MATMSSLEAKYNHNQTAKHDDSVTLPALKLEKPHGSQTDFLPWKHLSQVDVQRLSRCNAQEKREYLNFCLNLTSYYHDAALPIEEAKDSMELLTRVSGNEGNGRRREIFLDLCLSVLNFASTHKFSSLQTSTFFSILVTVHQTACEQPERAPPLLQQVYRLFEELLLKHSVERPPFSIQVFAVAEVKNAIDYFVNTYCRHLKLYQFVFGTSNHLVVAPTYSIAQAVNQDEILPLQSCAEYFPHENSSFSSISASSEGNMFGEDEKKQIQHADFVSYDDLSDTEGLHANQEDVPAFGKAPEIKIAQVFSNPSDQLTFEEELTLQMDKLHSNFQKQLKQQQDEFLKRLQQVEGKSKSKRGKK